MREKKKKIQIMALCCLLLLLAGCKNQAGFYVEKQEETDNTQSVPEEVSQESEELQVPQPKEMIYVQVSGAVKNPGVYELAADSRIFEVIALAGGMTDEADVNGINQAQVLQDGQLIYVYAIGEQREQTDLQASQDDGKINLNTATAEELMTLPGVGQSKADSIISWREEYGAFESIEDIMNIQGIKEGVFSKMKDHIKVN